MSSEAGTITTSPSSSRGRAKPVVRRRRMSKGVVLVYALRALLLAVVIVAWQLIGGQSKNTAFFVSTPVAVWHALTHLVTTGEFWTDLRYTMYETVVGFLIAGAAGILFGFALALSYTAHRVIEPLMNALNSLPRIALASLFILWFGLGTSSKIALVISLVFFPFFLNSYKGATTIDSDIQLLMRTLNASRFAYMRKVTLPSTVPWIIAGAKLGIALALGGAIVGEIIASQHGLGAELNVAAESFNTAQEFAVLIVLIIAAMILNGIAQGIEARASRWR